MLEQQDALFQKLTAHTRHLFSLFEHAIPAFSKDGFLDGYMSFI